MRETSVKGAVAVSPSAFSQKHSLEDAVYLFILILYAAHADVYSLALQKRKREICVLTFICGGWISLLIIYI